jgi:hypothetical protein
MRFVLCYAVLCFTCRPADDSPQQHGDQPGPTDTQQLHNPPPQEQQQQQQGRRRVTFSEDAVQQERRQQQQQQQQQWRRPLPGGRGRGRGVPDHVANPQKYTVYELAEPLFVGQGGADVQSEAAASSWQQQRQQWGGPPQQQQQTGKARQLDASSRAETEGPVEEFRLGASTAAAAAAADVAPMEVEESGGVPAELPAAGSIKFAPTGGLQGEGWQGGQREGWGPQSCSPSPGSDGCEKLFEWCASAGGG